MRNKALDMADTATTEIMRTIGTLMSFTKHHTIMLDRAFHRVTCRRRVNAVSGIQDDPPAINHRLEIVGHSGITCPQAHGLCVGNGDFRLQPDTTNG
jgi:hypothetical protein